MELSETEDEDHAAACAWTQPKWKVLFEIRRSGVLWELIAERTGFRGGEVRQDFRDPPEC